MKPCVVGIVLATGIYMIFSNCFGNLSAVKVNVQAVIVTILLLLSMFAYKKAAKRKLSPIMLIILSAVIGIVVYGI